MKAIKIKSIKYIGRRKTFDIEVKDNHNFLLANNILSHNSETQGCVQGSDDFTIIFNTDSPRDKEMLCAPMRRDKRMTQFQMADISMLDRGECYVVEKRQKAVKVKFALPRTLFWSEEKGNFYKVAWKKAFDTWMDTRKIVDDMETQYRKVYKKFKDSTAIKSMEKASENINLDELQDDKIDTEDENEKDINNTKSLSEIDLNANIKTNENEESSDNEGKSYEEEVTNIIAKDESIKEELNKDVKKVVKRAKKVVTFTDNDKELLNLL